jgi:hypothetical protein
VGPPVLLPEVELKVELVPQGRLSCCKNKMIEASLTVLLPGSFWG